MSTSRRASIAEIRTWVPSVDAAGDYFRGDTGHWLTDSVIANPMSVYPEYRESGSAGGSMPLAGWSSRSRRLAAKPGSASPMAGKPAPRSSSTLPLPDRLRSPRCRTHLGPALAGLSLLWKKGDHPLRDQRRRSGALGPLRQTARRTGLHAPRRPHQGVHPLLRHRHPGKALSGSRLHRRQDPFAIRTCRRLRRSEKECRTLRRCAGGSRTRFRLDDRLLHVTDRPVHHRPRRGITATTVYAGSRNRCRPTTTTDTPASSPPAPGSSSPLASMNSPATVFAS